MHQFSIQNFNFFCFITMKNRLNWWSGMNRNQIIWSSQFSAKKDPCVQFYNVIHTLGFFLSRWHLFFLSKFRRSQRQRIISLLYKSGTNDSDHRLGPTLLRGGGSRGDRGRDVPLPWILVFSIKNKPYSFKSICIPLPPFTFSDPPPALFLLYGLGLKTGFSLLCNSKQPMRISY